jgi:hypothetical protein
VGVAQKVPRVSRRYAHRGSEERCQQHVHPADQGYQPGNDCHPVDLNHLPVDDLVADRHLNPTVPVVCCPEAGALATHGAEQRKPPRLSNDRHGSISPAGKSTLLIVPPISERLYRVKPSAKSLIHLENDLSAKGQDVIYKVRGRARLR